MADLKAYKQSVTPSDFKVEYDGKEFALLGCTCLHCDYSFFVPALREHEPSYCPNCGIRFIGVKPDKADL